MHLNKRQNNLFGCRFWSVITKCSFVVYVIVIFVGSAGSVENYIGNDNVNNTEIIRRVRRSSGSHDTVLSIIKFIDCEDLRHFCPQLKQTSDNISLVLCGSSIKEQQNNVESLNENCQSKIKSFTKSFLQETELQKSIRTYCPSLDKSLCKDNQLSKFLFCAFDNDSKDPKCAYFLKQLKLVMFLEPQATGLLLEECTSEAKTYCNDPGIDKYDMISGEETFRCLQEKLSNLKRECKEQILRLSEIQGEDIRYNRQLYLSCSNDRLRFCQNPQASGPMIYACLMHHRLEVSQQCSDELLRHEQMIATDYRVSRGLARVCKDDIRLNHCRKSTSTQKVVRLAQILLCLENATRNGTGVSKMCSTEMLAHRRMLMEDYRLSPELVSACTKDITKQCNGLEAAGKTIHCLMEHAKARKRVSRITPECQRALETLIKETDAGEDWRVDPLISESCQPVVTVGCSNARGGNGRVMSCLMERLGTEMMTDECETALLQVQYFIARDYKLDAALYRACRDDAVNQCHAKRFWADDPEATDPERGPFILPCLYRLSEKKKLKKSCEGEVLRVMHQRAISVRLQPELELDCLDDLASLCYEKTGPGEEILCLQDKLDQLSPKCKSAVSNFTELQSVHLEMNPVILNNCRQLMDLLCQSEVSTGNGGDVLDCLIEHKNDALMRSQVKCRAAVEHQQLISLKDYHFTFRFKEACSLYVTRYCHRPTTKQEVVWCLSEVVRNSTLNEEKAKIPKECRHQLRAQLLQARESIDLDPKLRLACLADIQSLCPNVPHGNARVLECLESKKKNLTNGCYKWVFKVEKQDLADSSTDYTLLNTCRAMILKYCHNSNPSQALDCLKRFKYEPEFERECRSIVIRRMAEEASDYRLNPSLQKDCYQDINKFCSQILLSMQDLAHVEGRVIKCLKGKFRERKLSLQCEQQLGVFLKEAALNYQLNPVLTTLCAKEIKELCSDEEAKDSLGEGKVEECLKSSLLSGLITTRACKLEVVELINEGRADIQADPLLYRACTYDIKKHCADINSGNSRVLECLLYVLRSEDKSKYLRTDCRSMLSQRVEMYKIAPARPVETVGELYSQMSNSPSHRYFMVLTLTFIGMIFITGLFCGRVMRRSVIVKNK